MHTTKKEIVTKHILSFFNNDVKKFINAVDNVTQDNYTLEGRIWKLITKGYLLISYIEVYQFCVQHLDLEQTLKQSRFYVAEVMYTQNIKEYGKNLYLSHKGEI